MANKIMYMILIAFVVALCYSTPLAGSEDDEFDDGEYYFDTDTSDLITEYPEITPKDFDNDYDSDIPSNDDELDENDSSFMQKEYFNPNEEDEYDPTIDNDKSGENEKDDEDEDDEDEMVDENDDEDDDGDDEKEEKEEEEVEEDQNYKNEKHATKSNDEVPTSDNDNNDSDDNDDDEDDEMEVAQMADQDEELIKLLAKPKRNESELLDIFVKILQSYTKMDVGQPEYANVTSTIEKFLKNPTRQELFVLFKNTSIFDADEDSDELNRLIKEFEAITNSTTSSSEEVIEVSTEETDKHDNSDQIIVPQDIADTLDYLVDPDIPKALDATEELNALENEHSKNITIEDQGGFEFVNMTSQFQSTKGLKKKHLLKRIKKELQGTVEQEEILKGILDNILDHVENGKNKQSDGLFSVISDAGNGFANAIFIYYKEREDGKYNMKKLRFEGKIKLAATLVITRVSTSNSTNSDSKDIISYVPRDNATEIDVARLLKMMVPDLGKVLSKLSVDDSNKHNDFMGNKFF